MIKCLLLLLLACTWAPAQPTPDPVTQESHARHEQFVRAGYNLTYGLTLAGSGNPKPCQVEFLVSAQVETHRLSLWLKTRGGEAQARLRGADGLEVFAWSGQEGELQLVRQLPMGKYLLEIASAGSQGGRAEFAVKGPLMPVCKPDPERCREVPADPAQGFRSPYLLYVPRTVKNPSLLVVPNNTGFAVENLEVLRAAGQRELQNQQGLADRLGCPLLVPLFPRPVLDATDLDAGNLYLHALSRDALVAQRPDWKRVDLQLLGMIEDARTRLAAQGRPVEAKVLLSGFSAAGMFVNRFGLLHPERVRAVACGSPGGWPMAPVAKVAGEPLPYPVGCADLAALVGRPMDRGAVRKVAWFFYLGAEDRNDAVVCRDSFARSDQEVIFRRFGATLPERWRQAERLYAAEHLSAVFRLYGHAAHEVTQAMAEDLAGFFEAQLKRP